MTDPFLMAFKVTALVLAALAAAAILRRTSAAFRHWVLSAGIAGAAMLPVLAAVVPSWELFDSPPPVRRVLVLERWGDRAEATAASINMDPPASPPAAPMQSTMPDLGTIASALWGAGAGVSLLVLGAGLLRLWRFASAATPVDVGPWTEQLEAIAGELGVRRPVRLLLGDDPSLIVTWGWRRPAIVLPAAATEWPPDAIRVVLSHELAHIARGDWAVLIVAQLLRAFHWFNPVVWLACRRLRLESEHACDDAVLALGVAPPTYATHLLRFARAATRREWAPVLPVARPSGLERRVRAMLNVSVNRRPMTAASRLAVTLAFLIVAGAAAGLGTAAQGFASVSGSLLDPQRAALPGATLSISNAARETKTTVKTDSAGRFEFVGLPPGDYVLEIKVPGFRNVTASIALAGEHIERDFVMRVGQLEETITVTSSPEQAAKAESAEQREVRIARWIERRNATTRACTPAAEPGTVPVGGNIRPPVKLRDARPIYPAGLEAQSANVVIDATIGVDGTVTAMKPHDGPNPLFVRAATDAVSQWQFDQTLLNCVPIEVEMTVSVAFKGQP
jgi:beta-lactamase regulating signal transducer with metallopeptidase domain